MGQPVVQVLVGVRAAAVQELAKLAATTASEMVVPMAEGQATEGGVGREWEMVMVRLIAVATSGARTGGVAVPAGKGTSWRTLASAMATGIVVALGPSGAAMPMGMEVSTVEEMGEGMGDADGYVTLNGAGYGCGSACGDGELEGHGAGYGNGDMSCPKDFGCGDAPGSGTVFGVGGG